MYDFISSPVGLGLTIPIKEILWFRKLFELLKITSKFIEPNIKKTPTMPKANAKSPIRLTTKAFIAALFAEFL